MGHYVIRVAEPPDVDAEGPVVRLSVTDDHGRSRAALVRLSDGERNADVWGGAVVYAVEQIEFGFRGETWGVELEDVEQPLLIAVTEAVAIRLSENAPAIEAGTIVGEFDL